MYIFESFFPILNRSPGSLGAPGPPQGPKINNLAATAGGAVLVTILIR